MCPTILLPPGLSAAHLPGCGTTLPGAPVLLLQSVFFFFFFLNETHKKDKHLSTGQDKDLVSRGKISASFMSGNSLFPAPLSACVCVFGMVCLSLIELANAAGEETAGCVGWPALDHLTAI